MRKRIKNTVFIVSLSLALMGGNTAIVSAQNLSDSLQNDLSGQQNLTQQPLSQTNVNTLFVQEPSIDYESGQIILPPLNNTDLPPLTEE